MAVTLRTKPSTPATPTLPASTTTSAVSCWYDMAADNEAFYSCDWLGGDGESYDPVDHIKGQLKCHVKSMHKNEHSMYASVMYTHA